MMINVHTFRRLKENLVNLKNSYYVFLLSKHVNGTTMILMPYPTSLSKRHNVNNDSLLFLIYFSCISSFIYSDYDYSEVNMP